MTNHPGFPITPLNTHDGNSPVEAAWRCNDVELQFLPCTRYFQAISQKVGRYNSASVEASFSRGTLQQEGVTGSGLLTPSSSDHDTGQLQSFSVKSLEAREE